MFVHSLDLDVVRCAAAEFDAGRNIDFAPIAGIRRAGDSGEYRLSATDMNLCIAVIVRY
ncbi:MAG TPA: hypothetical protein VLV86_16860 [Vicinamibacterales bacterium]|nr:hypothetical protein [Thermoanaerobaculia bacterium]HUK35592.1 hypothetical protein [Vicinamibacterales bacterium]